MTSYHTDTPEDLKDFLETTAYIAGAAHIIDNGVQYVDNALFWKWIRESNRHAFKDGISGINKWREVHPRMFEDLVRTKGFEWDVFRDHRPHLVDVNELSASVNDRIKDLQSLNPLTGEMTPVQVKAPMSQGGIYQAANRLFTYPPDTKLAVTQSVYDETIKRGMSPERFVHVRSDDTVKSIAEERVRDVQQGNIEIGLTTEGVLNEISSGAMVGAIVYVGISAMQNYRSFRSGTMTMEEFAIQLTKDGVKGGITGGAFAAINVVVQSVATSLGVGAPVTIPVMLVIGVGLRKVIEPMFGDGEYAETLRTMQYSHSLQAGLYNFGILSTSLYNKQERLRNLHLRSVERAKLLNSMSSALDDIINSELAE